jgi:multidrug efflux pump subunit AcrA (membrane-fusion protein)
MNRSRRRLKTFLSLAITVIVSGFAACERSPTTEGLSRRTTAHDQGDGTGHQHARAPQETEGLEPIRLTVFSDKLQLFMEYPRLVRGESAEFLAHLTVLETGEPIRSGRLTFEVTGPDGKVEAVALDAPKRDGLFVPRWTFASAGRFRLRLSLDSPQAKDTVDGGELLVHETVHEANHAAADAGVENPPNLIPFLLEQQWKLSLRYEKAERRTLVERLPLPAQILAPQGASAAVSPPIAGRLQAPPTGRLPRVGDRVEAGQILALIEPPLPVSEVFQLSANVAQVQSLETELALRELDLETKALEVERSASQAAAKLDYARRAMQRVRELRAKGIGTEQQFDEATQNLQLAEAEFAAAQAAAKTLSAARERLNALRARAMPRFDIEGGRGARALPMRAPISGEIVSVAHIEGEHLDAAHQEVFRIVNLDHVWITANVSEFDLAALAESPGAVMSLPSYPGRRFDVLEGGGRLVHVGKMVDPQARTLSVVFEYPNRDGLFRIGMLADVFLETARAVDAPAIPEEAIVMDAGRPVAFVLYDGESFQRRELDLGVRDNGWVEVKDGVLAGERVVTRGAYALKLAAMSPASFGHGHVH